MCAPAHVLMSLYPIDKSLVCLQEGRHVRIYVLPISTTYDRRDITEVLLKVTLNTIKQTNKQLMREHILMIL